MAGVVAQEMRIEKVAEPQMARVACRTLPAPCHRLMGAVSTQALLQGPTGQEQTRCIISPLLPRGLPVSAGPQ